MERITILQALAIFLAAIFTATADVNEDVTFRLFTVNNRFEWRNLGFDVQNLTSSGFDFNKDTKIITHGFLNNGSGMSCIALRDAFLRHHDVNVIILDYERIANNLFTRPQTKINEAGGHLSKFLDFLMENGYSGSRIHILGHSLGAHVIGFAAGRTRNGRIARVSGLDPALTTNVEEGLTADVAEFVDNIHTAAGVYGTTLSIGTISFWPNRGRAIQPSCGLLGGITCSHYEAVRFMARSINDPLRYPAVFCASDLDFTLGRCNRNQVAYMGIAASGASGDFRLTTPDEGNSLE